MTVAALIWKRNVQLVLLIMVAVSAFYARSALLPLQESIRVALRLSDNQMALLQGLPIALGFLAAMPVGILIDRKSRARLTGAFVFLGIVASFLSAWAPSFFLLFAARCLVSVAVSAAWTSVLSLIADWYPPVQRGRATTAVAIGAVLGVSSSYALAGPLLNAFGSQADGWRWTMLGLTIPLLVVLVLLLALRDPPSPDGARHAVSSRGEYGQLWEHRSLVLPLVCGYALIGGIADGALLVWAGPVLMRSFAATPVSVGNIMATALLINGVAAPIIGGALADFGQRTGGPPRTVMLLIGLLSVSVPLSLFALSPGILTASALLTLFFICGTSFQVSLMTLTTIVIPSHLRASCIAFLLALSNSFGYGVAPFLVSQLSTRLGGTDRVDISLSIVCFTSSVLGALAFWWTSRSWPSALAGGPARTRSLQHGTAL